VLSAIKRICSVYRCMHTATNFGAHFGALACHVLDLVPSNLFLQIMLGCLLGWNCKIFHGGLHAVRTL
jgi:hypothetical protein